jgi:hypothetical protein
MVSFNPLNCNFAMFPSGGNAYGSFVPDYTVQAFWMVSSTYGYGDFGTYATAAGVNDVGGSITRAASSTGGHAKKQILISFKPRGQAETGGECRSIVLSPSEK